MNNIYIEVLHYNFLKHDYRQALQNELRSWLCRHSFAYTPEYKVHVGTVSWQICTAYKLITRSVPTSLSESPSL